MDSTIAAAVIGTVVSVNTILFGWLKSSFSELRVKMEEYYNSNRELIYENESCHKKEHLENLHRFERISVALARLGSDNGVHKRESP